MALRHIVTEGDDVLRKKAKPVSAFDDKLHLLLDDMKETMCFEGRGIGLAAPQVGVLRRVFVVDVHDEHGLLEFINPIILSTEGEVVSCEGCLSVPNHEGKVWRPEKLLIRAQDRTGATFEVKAQGLLAICIAHENDHLDGILYIDKLIEEQEES